MTLFEELQKKVHKKTNSNFHFDRLNWVSQVWFALLCDLLEEKLKEKEKFNPLTKELK